MLDVCLKLRRWVGSTEIPDLDHLPGLFRQSREAYLELVIQCYDSLETLRTVLSALQTIMPFLSNRQPQSFRATVMNVDTGGPFMTGAMQVPTGNSDHVHTQHRDVSSSRATGVGNTTLLRSYEHSSDPSIGKSINELESCFGKFKEFNNEVMDEGQIFPILAKITMPSTSIDFTGQPSEIEFSNKGKTAVPEIQVQPSPDRDDPSPLRRRVRGHDPKDQRQASLQDIVTMGIELATTLRLSLVESQKQASREQREDMEILAQLKERDEEVEQLKG
ncbi:hypothetical protein G7Y89_g14631 [Cudoniella acicularis]|uniref:Uncharacterized protein n=1 Tax=Cudoniella acicularis TaxID=354080 RepID=A0A8H4VTY1_9HELO|nr:hypothetical protein G7Y89_g14631 [Cudoniella acicularis]